MPVPPAIAKNTAKIYRKGGKWQAKTPTILKYLYEICDSAECYICGKTYHPKTHVVMIDGKSTVTLPGIETLHVDDILKKKNDGWFVALRDYINLNHLTVTCVCDKCRK